MKAEADAKCPTTLVAESNVVGCPQEESHDATAIHKRSSPPFAYQFNRYCSRVRRLIRCSRTSRITAGCFRVYQYKKTEQLLATLAEKVIAPAEGKAQALAERRRLSEEELTKPR
jgi:hypothetical protein